ncbi:MAG: Copper homeostasis protein CutC [Bacteroidota bacterium]|jgi:copper homeostasis protein
MKLEICCPSISSAIIAEQCGADRIEFCINLAEGGTTPTFDEIVKIKKAIKIPIHVLIRIRAGNFYYTEFEINEMAHQIEFCKQNKIDGVVIGALNSDHTIDATAIKKWLKIADGLDITFHKAFDEIENKAIALNQLINLNFNRILTSGHKGTALQGIESLKQLQKIATDKIIIMPGGSIRSSNLLDLKSALPIVTEFHSAAAVLQNEALFAAEITAMKSVLNN